MFSRVISVGCLLVAMVLVADAGDEFFTIEKKTFQYHHELRVTSTTEKSERITNPLRWMPLSFFVPDGSAVKKGDVIAKFNSEQSLHEEKTLVLEMDVVDSRLQRRLTNIDNQELDMSESLEALEDKLAASEAKLTRLLSEPNPDDIRIAEGKLKIANLNLRLARSDLKRAQGRFKRGMISQAELDSVQKTYEEDIVKYVFADKELELTLTPLALPYNVKRTRLEIENARLEIAKLKSEMAEQAKLSEIQKKGASQQKRQKERELRDKRKDISNMIMKAPIDGYVSHRQIDGGDLHLGQRMWPNMTFMDIPDLTTICFQGMMLESVRKHFNLGDQVEVRLNGELDKTIMCTLSQISTLSHDLSEKSNSRQNLQRKFGVKVFDVTFKMNGTGGNVRPGMNGIATMTARQPLEGGALPLKYVRFEDGKHFIIVKGDYVEVTGVVCDGWFVLDDDKWIGTVVGMRGVRVTQEQKGDGEEEKRLSASGELEPVKKTDVQVGDIGWWPWPKVLKLAPDESIVKKGDIIAELDPKEREQQIERQESNMAEIRSDLEACEKRREITRRNGEFKIKMAKCSLEIQRLTTQETLDDSRRPLSYFRAIMNRDLARLKLADAKRKVDREHAKAEPTLSPLEIKKLERNQRRAELQMEKTQLALQKEEEGTKETKKSRARLDLLEQESRSETTIKSVAFDNASIDREYEGIKQHMTYREQRLKRRREQKAAHTVRAPVDGLICYNKVRSEGSFQKIAVGSSVGPRFTIMTIPDLSEMEVMVEVPEQYFPNLEVGLPVEVRVPSLSDERLQGQVAKIDLLFTNRGRKDSDLGLYSSREPLGEVVFKVRVHFQSGGLALKPGLVSEVYFPFAR